MGAVMAARVAYDSNATAPNHIARLVGDGRGRTIYGTVSDWPDIREHTTLITLRVDSTRLDKRITHHRGGVQVRIGAPTNEFQYGDRLILWGLIEPVFSRHNPHGLDYQRYLRWRDMYGVVALPHPYGIRRDATAHWSVASIVTASRAWILGVFDVALSPAQSAVAAGFLLGETSRIDRAIYRHFRNSGALHLLAVSGANVAFALLALRLALWPFPLRRRTVSIILIGGAIFYCYLCHSEPSVVRATVMACVFLVGRALERRVDYHNLIAVSALLVLWIHPAEIYYVGFLLSYAVSWALILYAPALTTVAGRHAESRWFRWGALPVGLTVVAQVASAPLTLYFFGETPLIGVAANVVVGPIVWLATMGVLATLAASVVWSGLGVFIGAGLNWWLGLMLSVLEYFGGGEIRMIRMDQLNPLTVAMSLACVAIIATIALARNARRTVTIVALGAFAITGLSWAAKDTLSGSSGGLWVYASGGGIFVTDSERGLIAVGDMTGAPADRMQYLVRPHLTDFGAERKVTVYALSPDHATIALALMICDSLPESRLIYPLSAAPTLADLAPKHSRRGAHAEPVSSPTVTLVRGDTLVIVRSHDDIVAQGVESDGYASVGAKSPESQIIVTSVLDSAVALRMRRFDSVSTILIVDRVDDPELIRTNLTTRLHATSSSGAVHVWND